MRKDMAKLLCERPRIRDRKAVGNAFKPAKHRDFEQMPFREKMKPKWQVGYKELNENLKPLYRYLEKQVGRPWDKVWSEIMQHIRLDNEVQRHILIHLYQKVERVSYGRYGEKLIHDRLFYGNKRFDPRKLDSWHLYVDPADGILKKAKGKNWFQKEKALKRERLKSVSKRMRPGPKPMTQYHLLNDCAWWLVTLAQVPMIEKQEKHPFF